MLHCSKKTSRRSNDHRNDPTNRSRRRSRDNSTLQKQQIKIDENYRSRSPNRKSKSTNLLTKSICDCFDSNREEKFSLKSELQRLANEVSTQSPNHLHEPQTPKTQKKLNKLVVNYNSSNEELVNSMREAILQNLLLNEHFCDYKISVVLYKPFIDMLKITKVINNLSVNIFLFQLFIGVKSLYEV